jgi:glycolate oxidase FAD binding subunit
MSTADSILPLTETLAPADRAGVAEAVRRAVEADTPVYPIGGGTSLDYGVRSGRAGLGLSLAGLARVVDYPRRDLTITVEAGITLAALGKKLAAKRQRLPIDVPRADRATLGGVVASDPSGPWRYRWGTVRDYVLALRAVDGTGQEFSAGVGVVKNAAGYNLCRLMTGSLGTLGVITQVTLMVRPLPERSALAACEVADFDMAERLLAELVRTDTLPSSIELLLGPAWREDPALAPHSGVGRLVVEFEGTKAEVDWMVERLRDRWQHSGVESSEVISAAKAGALRRRMTDFPAMAPARDEPAPLVVKLSVLPSATVSVVRQLLDVDGDCSIQAHAGNGVIVARLCMEPEAAAAMLDRKLRPLTTSVGGRLVVLSAPAGAVLDRSAVWGPPCEGLAVMQAIKDRFDPKGLLNPDRFVY